jgi:hypothetical protein
VVFPPSSPRPRRGTSMCPGGTRALQFHASGPAARGWKTSMKTTHRTPCHEGRWVRGIGVRSCNSVAPPSRCVTARPDPNPHCARVLQFHCLLDHAQRDEKPASRGTALVSPPGNRSIFRPLSSQAAKGEVENKSVPGGVSAMSRPRSAMRNVKGWCESPAPARAIAATDGHRSH